MKLAVVLNLGCGYSTKSQILKLMKIYEQTFEEQAEAILQQLLEDYDPKLIRNELLDLEKRLLEE